MKVALEEDTDVPDITQQLERTQFNDLGSVAEHHRQDHSGEHRAAIT